MSFKLSKHILTLLIASGSLWPAAAQMPNMPPPPVSVAATSQVTTSGDKRFVGYITAQKKVALQPRVSGILQKANFHEGDMVKQGDLLFEIEDTSYRAKMLSAKAALAKAEAEWIYAKDNFARKDLLFKQNAGTGADKEDATRLLDLAQANVDAAKAELMNAENDLSYTKIYAPISGKIGKTSVSTGNYLTPNSVPLNTVMQISPIYVRLSLSNRDYLNLTQDDADWNEHLKFDLILSNDEQYHANWKIGVVNNQIDANTDTIDVWLSFDNPDGKLVPGGYVTINMAEKLANPLVAVPLTALLNDATGAYVYMVNDKNEAHRRNVTLGHTVGDKITVLNGLEGNERIVVEGTHKITRPGMTVSPVEENK